MEAQEENQTFNHKNRASQTTSGRHHIPSSETPPVRIQFKETKHQLSQREKKPRRITPVCNFDDSRTCWWTNQRWIKRLKEKCGQVRRVWDVPGFQEAPAIAMAKTSEGGRLGAPEKQWLKSMHCVHFRRERDSLLSLSSLSRSLSAFPGWWIGPIGSQLLVAAYVVRKYSPRVITPFVQTRQILAWISMSALKVSPDDVRFRFPAPTIGDVVKNCSYRFVGYSY